jgi:small subunit ribosomal protein S15
LPTQHWDAGDESNEARRRERAAHPSAKDGPDREFGASQTDTGSTKVQVALLTQRISELTEHMKIHKHDHHSRRGLLKLVGRRRRLLTYMQRHDLEGYRALIKELGLRR